MKMLKVKVIAHWMLLRKRRRIMMILTNKVIVQMNQMMMMMSHLLIWMTIMMVLCTKISLRKEMMLKRIEMLNKKEDNTMILLIRKWLIYFKFVKDFIAHIYLLSKIKCIKWDLKMELTKRFWFLIWTKQCFMLDFYRVKRMKRMMMVTILLLYNPKNLGVVMCRVSLVIH